MKNCLFCHRPISGECCKIEWLMPTPCSYHSPYGKKDGRIEYAHPECLLEAQRVAEGSAAAEHAGKAPKTRRVRL